MGGLVVVTGLVDLIGFVDFEHFRISDSLRFVFLIGGSVPVALGGGWGRREHLAFRLVSRTLFGAVVVGSSDETVLALDVGRGAVLVASSSSMRTCSVLFGFGGGGGMENNIE